MKTWFWTKSGIRFDLINPTSDMFNIYDTAHALSHINRFNGHLKRPYSVAEHLCRCYDRAKSISRGVSIPLETLIHDFAEAYYHDIISPLKNLYTCKIWEDTWQEKINKLILGRKTFRHKKIVKEIDRRMLCTEAAYLGQQKEIWWSEKDVYKGLDFTEQHWTAWRDRLTWNVERCVSSVTFETISGISQPQR